MMEDDTYLVAAAPLGAKWTSDGITYIHTKHGWISEENLTEYEAHMSEDSR